MIIFTFEPIFFFLSNPKAGAVRRSSLLFCPIEAVYGVLIPEMSQGRHSNVGTLCFALGFSLMMALDVALG